MSNIIDIVRGNSGFFTAIAAIFTIVGTIIGVISAPFTYPTINEFDAIPNAIFKNDTAKLTWAVSNANAVNIKDIGTNFPIRSSAMVRPTESTNYSLIATRWSGFIKSTAIQEVHVWDPKVNIISPIKEVKASATISGTFSGDLPENYYIWIVVRSAKAGGDQWWTQGDAPLDRSPNWFVLGSFGGEQDVGENFIIKAILVDETVNYILKANGKNGIFLPTTIRILNTTTVIRIPGDLVIDITNLENGDHVSTPVSLEGTIYGTIPKDHDIWTIHSPINSGLWYPDGSIVESMKNNIWNRQIYLVNPGEYNIKVILVDNETSKRYQNYLKIGYETDSYEPFLEYEEEGRVKVLASMNLIEGGE